ncbi:MAG: class I SAM-dependent methyltransferase [Myxococcota bacterium]|nr:class I SAM-dependent methyltransferase [Myxococcota bacterium]
METSRPWGTLACAFWFACSSIGCGGAPLRTENVAAVERAWAEDFFPPRVDGTPETEDWGRHRALVYGRRVYASNGDDMATQVVAALVPFVAARGRAGTLVPRVALLGIGSGIELRVLLHAGARVDLYEPDARMLANAMGLGAESPLDFTNGVPAHPALRIVRSAAELPEGPPPYDAIIHCNALTVLALPPAIFVRERFARLAQHLRPGGVVGVHLQLYEIRQPVYQSFVATFASALPHVVVLSGDDNSSDSLLVGSSEPIVLDPQVLADVHDEPALHALLETAHLYAPLDLYGRVLLRDGEPSAWFGAAPPYSEAAPFPLSEWPMRPPQPIGGAALPDAVWDEWSSEVEAWSEREHLVPRFFEEEMYAPSWAYGDPCAEPLLRCDLAGRPLTPIEALQVARAHVAHGRYERAVDALDALSPSDARQRLIDALSPLLGRLPQLRPFEVLGRAPNGALESELGRIWDLAQAGDRELWPRIAVELRALSAQASGPAESLLRYLGAYAALLASDSTVEDAREALEAIDAMGEHQAVGALALRAFALSLNGQYADALRAAERATEPR